MLNRFASLCYLVPPFAAVVLACLIILGLVSGCSRAPIQGRQITAAPEIRHAQHFETELVASSPQQCIVRTKLPNQRLAGTWVDERNSALRAALMEARACCDNPKLRFVADWMVGFTAYEAHFDCPEP